MNMRECMKEINSCMMEANQMIMEEKSFINCARTGTDAIELDVLAGYLETASDSILALAEATSLTVIKPDPKKISLLGSYCNHCISEFRRAKENWKNKLN